PPSARIRSRTPRAASRPKRLPPAKKIPQRRPNVASRASDPVSYVALAPPPTWTTVGEARSKRTTDTPDLPPRAVAWPIRTPRTPTGPLAVGFHGGVRVTRAA